MQVPSREPVVRGTLVTLLTLGIANFFWLRQADLDLHTQFPDVLRGRPQADVHIRWPRVPLQRSAYYQTFARNLNAVQASLGLPQRPSPSVLWALHLMRYSGPPVWIVLGIAGVSSDVGVPVAIALTLTATLSLNAWLRAALERVWRAAPEPETLEPAPPMPPP